MQCRERTGQGRWDRISEVGDCKVLSGDVGAPGEREDHGWQRWASGEAQRSWGYRTGAAGSFRLKHLREGRINCAREDGELSLGHSTPEMAVENPTITGWTQERLWGGLWTGRTRF